MSTKTFISLLLLPIFIGKLFVVDAGVLKILSPVTISYVKPYCKKNQSGSDSIKTYEFEQTVETGNNTIELSSFCTPQFNFNVFLWDFNISEVADIAYVIFTSRLSYLYLDSHSPPPRLI